MASAVCVLDLKGRLLLARDYRGDVPLRLAERFMGKLGELEEGSPRPPVVLMDGEDEREETSEAFPFPARPLFSQFPPSLPSIIPSGVTFAFVEHANVILLAMTRVNANAAALIVYLHRLKDGE